MTRNPANQPAGFLHGRADAPELRMAMFSTRDYLIALGALGAIAGGILYVQWRTPPVPPAYDLPPRKIMLYSANMHMIPSSPEVARRLMAVREGQYVRVAGWLVNVAGEGGAYWTTSLRRDDTGAGACEIVYVCDVSEIRWP